MERERFDNSYFGTTPWDHVMNMCTLTPLKFSHLSPHLAFNDLRSVSSQLAVLELRITSWYVREGISKDAVAGLAYEGGTDVGPFRVGFHAILEVESCVFRQEMRNVADDIEVPLLFLHRRQRVSLGRRRLG